MNVNELFACPAAARTKGVVGGLSHRPKGGAGVNERIERDGARRDVGDGHGHRHRRPTDDLRTNHTVSGYQLSDGFELSPLPFKVTDAVAPVKLAVSVPWLAPKAVGVKLTGTEMDGPAVSVAGSDGTGAPRAVGGPGRR